MSVTTQDERLKGGWVWQQIMRESGGWVWQQMMREGWTRLATNDEREGLMRGETHQQVTWWDVCSSPLPWCLPPSSVPSPSSTYNTIKRPWRLLDDIVVLVTLLHSTWIQQHHNLGWHWLHWDAFRRIKSNTDFLCGNTMGNAWSYYHVKLNMPTCSGLLLPCGQDSKHLSTVTDTLNLQNFTKLFSNIMNLS